MSGSVREKVWFDELVQSAIERVPFYRHHLAGADISSLGSVPSFDKRATAGYGLFPLSAGRRTPAESHRVMATSGTTGDRLFVAFDRADWDRVGAWLKGVAHRAGFGHGDVLLNTHCYGLWPGGPVLDLLAHRAGASIVPLGPTSPAGVMHVLAAGVGTAISATPSYLRRLIEAAVATGFDLRATPLRFGFIGAETAESALRRKLSSELPEGFQWVELYGLTETCGPSVACGLEPETPELELNTLDFHVEVLKLDVDVAAEPDAVGELTLTSRHPDSRSPLIRYRTRDLVRVTAGDPDAPTRVSRILGRVDDALKIGGVLMYPTAVAEIVTGMLPSNAEWLAVVRQCGEDAELLLQVEAGLDLCRAIEVAFQERVGLDVTVIPAEADTLARSREKSRRVVFEEVSMDAMTARRPTC